MNGAGGILRRRRAPLTASRLTVRIVLANLIGLVILLLGSFAITQFRDGLIEAKLEGVRAQAQIIADVLAQVAIDETSCQPVAVEDTLDRGDDAAICSLALVQGDVQEVFNRVWDSFEGRVRIFNAPQTFDDPPVSDASLLLIEDLVLREDEIIAEALPSIENSVREQIFRERNIWQSFSELFSLNYREEARRRTLEAELNDALASSPFAEERGSTSVRILSLIHI